MPLSLFSIWQGKHKLLVAWVNEDGPSGTGSWQVRDSSKPHSIQPPSHMGMPPRVVRFPRCQKSRFLYKISHINKSSLGFYLNTMKAKPNKSMDQMQLVEGGDKEEYVIFCIWFKVTLLWKQFSLLACWNPSEPCVKLTSARPSLCLATASLLNWSMSNNVKSCLRYS